MERYRLLAEFIERIKPKESTRVLFDERGKEIEIESERIDELIEKHSC